MKKFRKVMALIGIAVLVLMYVACLVFALMKSEQAQTWFRMALGATIAVPIVLYALLLISKQLQPENPPDPHDGQAPDAPEKQE